jgi:hypothetical protein
MESRRAAGSGIHPNYDIQSEMRVRTQFNAEKYFGPIL